MIWKTTLIFSKWKTTSSLAQMKDNLNSFFKCKTTLFVLEYINNFQWKTTWLFSKWKTTSYLSMEDDLKLVGKHLCKLTSLEHIADQSNQKQWQMYLGWLQDALKRMQLQNTYEVSQSYPIWSETKIQRFFSKTEVPFQGSKSYH